MSLCQSNDFPRNKHLKRRSLEAVKRVMVVVQRPIPPKGHGIEQEFELGIKKPDSQRFSLITPESYLLLRKMTASPSLENLKN